MDNFWHEPQAGELDAPLADWLLEPGSLTARLRTRCGDGFHLDVHREARARADEIPDIWPAGPAPRVREVALNCRGRPLVFARTLIPDSAAVNDRWLLELGNRPLGDVLFQSGGVRKRGFEIARLAAGDELFQRALQALAESDSLAASTMTALWARRSWVELHGERLLICECFLPGLI